MKEAETLKNFDGKGEKEYEVEARLRRPIALSLLPVQSISIALPERLSSIWFLQIAGQRFADCFMS